MVIFAYFSSINKQKEYSNFVALMSDGMNTWAFYFIYVR